MAETELARLEITEPTEAKSPAVMPAPAVLRMSQVEEHASWPTLSQLRLLITASVALSGFKVRDLLRLEPAQVIESAWPETEDVPLIVSGVQVAWSEFEVVEQHLVVRLTRLA